MTAIAGLGTLSKLPFASWVVQWTETVRAYIPDALWYDYDTVSFHPVPCPFPLSTRRRSQH